MFSSLLRRGALLLAIVAAAPALAQTTVTLQDGLNTYAGTTDAWLWSGDANANNNAASGVLRSPTTAMVLKFAIFASEGGPVPDGATITSATLSIYKFNSPDGVFNAKRLLRSWQETQVTWNSAASGSAWATPGATGATDVTAAGEAQMTLGTGAAWGNFNVTAAVQAMAGGNNHGWRLQHISADNGPHEFYASEAGGSNTALRPKLAITYNAPPPPGTTATLMQGLNSYGGTTDARIARGAPTANVGEAASYDLIRESDTSLLVRFKIFASEGGPVPNDATISSATLSLYKFFGAAATFKASRLKKDWNEAQVTWNQPATGASWTTAGAMGSDTDYFATADGQAAIGDSQADGCGTTPAPAACWLDIDVTAGVQAFKPNPAATNFGWKIAYVTGANENSHKEFHSSESGTAAASLRPKLTITYTMPGVPSVPTASFAWSQVSGTFNVQFNAAGSQENGATITQLRLRFGHGNPEAEDTWDNKDQVRTHSFPGAGTYPVKLVATNAEGASPEYTANVVVTSGPVPTANLGVDKTSGAPPLTVTFDASGSSSDPSAPITHVRLSFGDGTADAVDFDWHAPLQHTYQVAGQYTATFTATNANGDSAPVTRTISVGNEVLPGTDPAGTRAMAVETFHSMGLYYNPVNPPAGCATDPTQCRVWMRYRKSTEPNSAWRQGYPLWFDKRQAGDGESLPYTSGTNPYPARGSAVHLETGTKYFFEFGTGTSYAEATWHHHVARSTWPDVKDFPTIAGSTDIPNSLGSCPAAGPCRITVGGDPNNGRYRVYDGCLTYDTAGKCTSKRTIDRGTQGLNVGGNHHTVTNAAESQAMVIEASYVIVRNIRVSGSAVSSIYIAPGVSNVVIEDSELTNFGKRPGVDIWPNDGATNPNPNHWTGTRNWGWNTASGVFLARDNSRIVIQRNIIKEPALGSFPWDTIAPNANIQCVVNPPAPPLNHPHGPNGITVEHGGVQNVIRYNEITGHETDDRRWYFDGIGGAENFSTQGTPGNDSDIYQNIIKHVFDDAIESEGGGRNVRVWGNYMSQVKTAVATSTVHFGPHYTWRNVVGRVRICYDQVADQDQHLDWRSAAFKVAGIKEGFGNGIRYLFHNTLLQPGSGSPWDGAGKGLEADGNGGPSARYTVMRNNILHVRKNTSSSPDTEYSIEGRAEGTSQPEGSDFSFNLINGRLSSYLADPDAFRFSGPLGYLSGHGPGSDPSALDAQGNRVGIGNFQLAAGTQGRDTWGSGSSCDVLPNFSDNQQGGKPDCGAHEAGTAPMKFGVNAGQ